MLDPRPPEITLAYQPGTSTESWSACEATFDHDAATLLYATHELFATTHPQASSLYARNVLDFLKLVFTKEGQFDVNLEDDIVAACLMCRDGQVIRKNA